MYLGFIPNHVPKTFWISFYICGYVPFMHLFSFLYLPCCRIPSPCARPCVINSMFRVTYFFQSKATQTANLTQRSPFVGKVPHKSNQPNYNIFGFPWWKILDFLSINKLLTRSFIRESLAPINQ